jgi:hypothetical protein
LAACSFSFASVSTLISDVSSSAAFPSSPSEDVDALLLDILVDGSEVQR